MGGVPQGASYFECLLAEEGTPQASQREGPQVSDDFFAPTSQTRVVDDLPRVKHVTREETRQQYQAAVDAARVHLNCIQHNPLAVRRQEAVILKCELRLAQFDQEEWLET
jgi:hypothetical protein